MRTILKWFIALFGWIILLALFGIWRSLDKELETSAVIGGIRGALLGGGIFLLYHWASKQPEKGILKQHSTSNEACQSSSPSKVDYYAVVAKEIKNKNIDPSLLTRALADGNGDKAKTTSIYIKFRIDQLVSQAKTDEQHADKNNLSKALKRTHDESITSWAIGSVFKGLLVGVLFLFLGIGIIYAIIYIVG